MRGSLRTISTKSLTKYSQHPRTEWLKFDPAQVTLLVNMCAYV